MKIPVLLAIFSLAALAGCATPDPAPASAPVAAVAAPAPAPAPQCNADGAKFAIGQPATAPLEAAARVRAHASTSRLLKPGQAATMELDDDRLNLNVDSRNRVKAVHCG